MSFMESLREESIKTATENGAIGFSTTGKALVDLNFKIPSYRSDKDLLKKDIASVLDEKDPYILKYLFYLRDIRGGLGERDAFRFGLSQVLTSHEFVKDHENKSEIVESILKLIPEYGRWDDLLVFLGTGYKDIALDVIKNQLVADEKNMSENKSISLLAKWMPSDNATSKTSRTYAKIIARYLGISTKEYRKRLVALRRYLDVVEVKTCSNRWSEIDYNKVSSNANLRYNTAFLKHDCERRTAYLAALERGDTNVKMHSATNFPHDIVARYSIGKYYSGDLKEYDATLEQAWKNLPDMPGLDNTLVVRDGSGSMLCNIGHSSVTAMNVADAITLYCAARCKSEFKDRFITFSSEPEFVDVSNKETLHDKLFYLHKFDDCSNTDLEATFDLILRAAVTNHLNQEDLPSQIMIVSDMEFDEAHTTYAESDFDTTPLMKTIKNKFKAEGYEMPKLVFWNVNSRTNAIPVTGNAAGVTLVSGFSVQTIEMVLSGETSPYEAILSVLNKDRYKEIPLLSYSD